MKFKTDENLPLEAADLLTAEGLDASSIVEQRLSGANDDKVSDLH